MGFDLGMVGPALFAVNKQYGTERNILDSPGRNEVSFECPAPLLGRIDKVDDLRPVLAALVAKQWHFDADHNLRCIHRFIVGMPLSWFQMAVQLFVTCLVNSFFPEVGEATVELLESAGEAVEFPADQTCCGQPAYNVGLHDDARKMAAHTLDVLDATDGPIVLPSGSCTDMIVHHIPELMAGDPRRAAQAERVAGRTRELSQFLVDDLGLETVGPGCGDCLVAYHPSCHGLRNLNLRTQAESLLDHAEGVERVELPDAENCCGFGGLFAVEMPEVSVAMMETKLRNVEASGATVLAGGDVSCLMHLGGGLHRNGSAVAVKHFAEILAGRLDTAHDD